MRSIQFAVLSALFTVGAGSGVSQAQSEAAGGLDEVVVTARKRVENLQDVPISISAIDAEQIARQGIANVGDVAALDSSLIFDKGYSATDTRIAVRGLSPSRGRVNVAILVDGVDISSESINFGGNSLLATSRLMDLQNVQIVKGPQAAQFGRSAFGGAINYVTKDPASEFSAGVRAEYSNFGRYNATASLSAPLGETFGWRLNAATWNDDGAHKNIVTGSNVGGGDGVGGALTLKWKPSENFDAKMRIEYSDDHYDPFAQASVRGNSRLLRPVEGTSCLAQGTGGAPGAVITPTPASQTSCRVYAPTAAFGGQIFANGILSYRGTVPDGDDLRVQLDGDPRTGKDYPGSDRKVNRMSLVMNWDFGPGVLTSLSGFTDAKFNWLEDGDFDSGRVSAANQLTATDGVGRATEFNYSNKTKQLSQELHFRSEFDGPVNFTVGGLYWHEKAEQVARSISILCLGAVPANTFFPGQPAFAPSCDTTPLNPADNATSILNGQQVLSRMTAIPRPNGREIDHRSWFGMIDWKVNNRVTLTAELRTSDENETINGVECARSLDAYVPAIPGLPPIPARGSPNPTLPPGVSLFRCGDPSFPGFQVFGPSINELYPFFNPFAPFAPGPGVIQAPGTEVTTKTKHKYSTPRFTLSYKATDDILWYANVSKGIKPGGISTVTSGSWQDADYDAAYDEFTYRAETLQQLELGFKGQFLSNRLRTNAAVFRMNYTDKQTGAQFVTPSGIQVGRIINAGKATVKGLELDAQFRATANLTLGLNYTWLDGEYDDFPFTSTSPTDASRNGGCPRGENPRLCYINLAGNKLERAPQHSIVGSARWEHGVADMLGGGNVRFFVEGDVQAQGERYIDIWNHNKLNDYVLGNIRLGLESDRWDVLLYVNNVTDNDTVLAAVNNPGSVDQFYFDPNAFSPSDAVVVSLPDPLVVGIRFGWKFGAK